MFANLTKKVIILKWIKNDGCEVASEELRKSIRNKKYNL